MKAKLLYLLIATIVLITALFITHQAGIIQSQAAAVERAVHLQAVELEREKTQAELDQQTEHLRQIEQRNAELEEMLINRARTYEIVAGGIHAAARVLPESSTNSLASSVTALGYAVKGMGCPMRPATRETPSRLLSRSGRQQIAAVDMPAQSMSGFTAAVFERAFEAMGARGMIGTGEAFVAAEEQYGINALVLAGICHLESGGGTSRIAQDKGNLAGLGAFDGSEYASAIRFSSREDSIMFLARLLAEDYAPGGKFYGGSHDLAGIGRRYASDPAWARKVAAIMGAIARAGVDDPGVLMAAAEEGSR